MSVGSIFPSRRVFNELPAELHGSGTRGRMGRSKQTLQPQVQPQLFGWPPWQHHAADVGYLIRPTNRSLSIVQLTDNPARAYNDMCYLCEKYAPLEGLGKYDSDKDPSVTGARITVHS